MTSYLIITRINKHCKKWMKSLLTSDVSSEYSVTTQVSVFKYHMIVRHQCNMNSLDNFDASISKFDTNYLGDAGS